MSLIVNVLKIRKAFSNPTVPHNPKHYMHIPDIEAETELSKTELHQVLDVLKINGVVEIEQPDSVSVEFVTVLEPYRELMGVGKSQLRQKT